MEGPPTLVRAQAVGAISLAKYEAHMRITGKPPELPPKQPPPSKDPKTMEAYEAELAGSPSS